MGSKPVEIHGETVIVRETTETDLADIMGLWNDGRVMKWVGYSRGGRYDIQKMENWFKWLQDNPDKNHFVAHTESIGFCGELFYAADRNYGRTGLDIKFVPQAQGQGLATDALQVFIQFIFETEPEVDAVWTEPSAENTAARKLYTKCGLRPKSRPLDMKPGQSYWELRREDRLVL